MSMSLAKGGNIHLAKVGLTDASPKFRVALGWDPAVASGVEFDLDAQAILVDAGEKAIDLPMLDKDLNPSSPPSKSLVFYNQRGDQAGAVLLSADDRTGGKAGDDETVDIDTGKLPANVEKVVFTATIHDAKTRGQNFGQVKAAYIRVLDPNVVPDPADPKKGELLRFDLSEDASTDNAMIFGELYRKDSTWKFRAVGNGTPGGLEAVARTYGVDFS